MNILPSVLEDIKRHEGLRLAAYPDPGSRDGKPWTIGYGHTGYVDGVPIGPGMTITEETADRLFTGDLRLRERAVRKLISVSLNDEQFSALVSISFNIGLGAFAKSTLLKTVNAGEHEMVPAEFARWIYNDGKVLTGLVKRRAEMGRLYMPNKLAYNHHNLASDSEWKWPDFSPAEMACKGTGRIMVDVDAMDALQRVRTRIGKPMLITSAYRSPEHNKAVGGAKNSYHMKGVAFDIQMANHDPAEFEKIAREEGFKGFGYYPNSGFLHIDTGPARSWGKKFPPRKTRFEEERPPVEVVEKKEKAKGAGATAGAIVVGTGAVEAAKQAKEITTSGKTIIDAIASYGPIVLIVVAVAVAGYFGWRWWQKQGQER